MRHARLIRSAGLLLAVTVVAALASTGGIAFAQGTNHHAARRPLAHVTRVAACISFASARATPPTSIHRGMTPVSSNATPPAGSHRALRRCAKRSGRHADE